MHSSGESTLEADALVAGLHPRTAHSESDTQGESRTNGLSESASQSGSEQHGGARTIANGRSRQRTRGVSEGVTRGTSESDTHGTSEAETHGQSEGRQQTFIQRPILEERESGIAYWSVPEQVLVYAQALVGLAPREALALCHGWKAPKKLRTLDIVDPYVRPDWVESFRQGAMAKYAFWLTYEDATARIAPPVLEGPDVSATLKSYGRRQKAPSAASEPAHSEEE
jgi:hypothetical protein